MHKYYYHHHCRVCRNFHYDFMRGTSNKYEYRLFAVIEKFIVSKRDEN